jgi:peptide chain release factor
MSDDKHEVWLQVSAGQGPAECAWAVVRTVEEIQREAAAASLEFRAVEMTPGSEAGTAESALISIRGALPLARFVEPWCGTVQWIALSPFRPEHKRKNWFVGVEVLEPVDEARLAARDLRWETSGRADLAASTSTETSRRSGLLMCRPESRPPRWKNDHSIATESWRWRDSYKIEALNNCRVEQAREERWRAHHGVERGNAVRVFRVGTSQ